MLGVCLGHQGLGHVRGATVVRGEDIVHGRISPIFHRGDGLFAGIPQGFRAVRYHSLVVEPALPPQLEAIAWSDDGTVMAIHARRTRAWGVQFHPESVGTEHGERLIENFLALTPRAPRAARPLGAAHGRAVPAAARALARRRRGDRRAPRRRGARPTPSERSPRCSATSSTPSGWTRASPTRGARASPSSARRWASSAPRSATACAARG